jgi:hypothetical protein
LQRNPVKRCQAARQPGWFFMHGLTLCHTFSRREEKWEEIIKFGFPGFVYPHEELQELAKTQKK